MELIQKLAETPLPQIFIIAGIFFLILSVVNKFGGKLDINPKRQGQAIVIGVILIIVGLAIFMQPTKPVPHNNPMEPNHECEISVYSIPPNEVLKVRAPICRIHISKGIGPRENEAEQRKITGFTVKVNNKELPNDGNIGIFEDERGEWHLEQFFEMHEIEPGIKYTLEGTTLEPNNHKVDSRLFFILRE